MTMIMQINSDNDTVMILESNDDSIQKSPIP